MPTPRRTIRNDHRSQIAPQGVKWAMGSVDGVTNQGLWLGNSTTVLSVATGATGAYPPPLTYSGGWGGAVYDAGSAPQFDYAAANNAAKFLPPAGLWRVSIQVTYMDTATAGGRRAARLMNVSSGPTEVGRFWGLNVTTPTSNTILSGGTTIRTDGRTWYSIEASWTGAPSPIDVRLDQCTWQQLAATRDKPI